MAFQVGQKVVCVKDTIGSEIARWCNFPAGFKSKKIAVGCVYVIREIDHRAVELHGVATLRFKEVVGKSRMTTVGMWENGWPADYFRPIIERKTDISIFTEMLDGTKSPEVVA